jgi:starch synthase
MDLPEALMDKPLIGMVSRLTAQKGINLLAEAAEEMFRRDVGLVVLGSGEPWWEDQAVKLKERFPDRMGLELGYDPIMAHRIIAGADVLLMPSLYEPCGLAQMFSLKYGTIPVVRATGGLNDTVFDPEDGHDPGTGFKFGPFQSMALLRAVRRAVAAYHDPDLWRAMVREAMEQDFSWERSAGEYIRVFLEAAGQRRGGGV